uniref:Uncharacterized protein n=1 Tax=Aegilops tauschii subsp. strangulata TaxID=200361 RepID=A0A453FLY9_AEGTS
MSACRRDPAAGRLRRPRRRRRGAGKEGRGAWVGREVPFAAWKGGSAEVQRLWRRGGERRGTTRRAGDGTPWKHRAQQRGKVKEERTMGIWFAPNQFDQRGIIVARIMYWHYFTFCLFQY